MKRSPVAQQLVRELMTAQVFRTSIQVFQELFVTLTRKVHTPLTAEQVVRYLDQIAAWPVVVLDYRGVRDAMELSSSAMISFWRAGRSSGFEVGSQAAVYRRSSTRTADARCRSGESVS